MTVTATPLGTLDVGSSEWHAARSQRLGGSEVAAALGLSPWCSPFTLYHRKKGLVDAGEESESMRWGKLLEPLIVDEYRRRHPDVYVHPGGSYADEWRIGAPDALVYPPELADGKEAIRLVEGKTADKNDGWEWGEDGSAAVDAIPPGYRVQCLWYMDILDIHALTLCLLLGGNEYREFDVPWDDAEAASIRERAYAFHRTVVDNVRPDIDSTSSTYQTVRILHEDIDGDLSVEVPAEHVDGWRDNQALAKHHDGQAQHHKSMVTLLMGGARYGLVAGTKAVRRQSTKGGTPYPVLIRQKETL